MRSLLEIQSDMKNITHLCKVRVNDGFTQGEIAVMLETLSLDVGELAKYVQKIETALHRITLELNPLRKVEP